MVDKAAEELRADLTAIIKTVRADLVSLGFTTDLWTSRALDSYISLTLDRPQSQLDSYLRNWD